MTDRVFQVKRYILLALVAGLLLLPRQLPAEPKLGKDDPTVACLVCAFLKQGHLSKPEIGDELSKRLFKRFLKDLDPNKLYFLKSDIDEFKQVRNRARRSCCSRAISASPTRSTTAS